VSIQLKPGVTHADDGDLRVQFFKRHGGGNFADIHLTQYGGAFISLDSAADCDRLIKAAILAKSLLLGETSEPVTDPLAPLRDAPHFGEGLPVLDDDGGDGDEEAPERTATPAEHADTAERIERAAAGMPNVVAVAGEAGARAIAGAQAFAASLAAPVPPINPAYVNTGLPKPGAQA
jgi:hypothetical protein